VERVVSAAVFGRDVLVDVGVVVDNAVLSMPTLCVAYLHNIGLLGPAAPLTGHYSSGGLNRLVACPLGGYFRLVYQSFPLSSLFWSIFNLYDRSVDRLRPFIVS